MFFFLNFSEAKSCLVDKHIAFIGDSRIRQLFYSFVKIINPQFKEEGNKVTPPHPVPSPCWFRHYQVGIYRRSMLTDSGEMTLLFWCRKRGAFAVIGGGTWRLRSRLFSRISFSHGKLVKPLSKETRRKYLNPCKYPDTFPFSF